MNDHIIKTLMQQRLEQILAEVRAAQLTQLKWQGIINGTYHKVKFFFSTQKGHTLWTSSRA